MTSRRKPSISNPSAAPVDAALRGDPSLARVGLHPADCSCPCDTSREASCAGHLLVAFVYQVLR